MMEDSRLTKTIGDNPTLCDIGFYHKYDDPEHFEAARSRMYKRSKAFDECIKWLRACKFKEKARSFDYCKHSSYALKRMIENKTGLLITNGIFLTAVLYLRIPYRSSNDNPNIIFLPLSKMSKPLIEGKMTY
jgi:hypothetical protein